MNVVGKGAKALRLSHKTTFKRRSTLLQARQKCHEMPRLPRKTTFEPVWKPSKMKGFAASPIDTAMPQEHQSKKTKHVGSSKRGFSARLTQMFGLCSYKINAFPRVFSWPPQSAISRSIFRARLLSIFSTRRKIPRLPRNVHVVIT